MSIIVTFTALYILTIIISVLVLKYHSEMKDQVDKDFIKGLTFVPFFNIFLLFVLIFASLVNISKKLSDKLLGESK